MRKLNYVFSILLTITLPLMIVILTSNFVLRTSEAYQYHFNDTQALLETGFDMDGETVSKAIKTYWSPFSSEKFQMYEKNGSFKDPIFEKKEQQVMAKAKRAINIELAVGLGCLIISVAIYVYLYRKNFIDALRNRFKVSSWITVGLLILHGTFWSLKKTRYWAYNQVIGIKLSKDSTLSIILGDPFFKTYVLLASILGVIVFGILFYVNYKLTKPDRIFS